MNQSLGKETIDTFNTGESRGREVSHSLNYQKLGKDLASIDELSVLDGGKCILQLRGVRPFKSDKYDITKHPNYKYLSDADPRNAFDIEKFLSTELKPKQDEVYDVYDVDMSDDAEASSRIKDKHPRNNRESPLRNKSGFFISSRRLNSQ